MIMRITYQRKVKGEIIPSSIFMSAWASLSASESIAGLPSDLKFARTFLLFVDRRVLSDSSSERITFPPALGPLTVAPLTTWASGNFFLVSNPIEDLRLTPRCRP